MFYNINLSDSSQSSLIAQGRKPGEEESGLAVPVTAPVEVGGDVECTGALL